jgi:hypothetical protein
MLQTVKMVLLIPASVYQAQPYTPNDYGDGSCFMFGTYLTQPALALRLFQFSIKNATYITRKRKCDASLYQVHYNM